MIEKILRDFHLNFFYDIYSVVTFELIVFFVLIISIVLILIQIENKTKKKFIIITSFVTILLCVYTLTPIMFYFLSMYFFVEKKPELGVKYENYAINTTINPYQKGFYCLELGINYNTYLKDGKNSIIYFDKAYNYLKSYDSKYWRLPAAQLYGIKEYDKALEIAKANNSDLIMADSYIMKKDFEKAYLCINKVPNLEKKPLELAKKAYIEKMLGKKDESIKTLNIALRKTEGRKDLSNKVGLFYEDFYGYEDNRLTQNEKNYGLD